MYGCSRPILVVPKYLQLVEAAAPDDDGLGSFAVKLAVDTAGRAYGSLHSVYHVDPSTAVLTRFEAHNLLTASPHRRRMLQ